ncbi:hypothetical protein WJX72_002858 [[Myrmecia] bisecta]|uniref:3D domain-containing protein n=1 Tax=[Myrmecia] bisecta TaxID=41462 RepID=A0AAW1P7H0_9CHLO
MGGQLLAIETTAYCSCGYCCNWEYGLMCGPWYLAFQKRFPLIRPRRRRKPRTGRKSYLVDKYWTATSLSGAPYEGLTATETFPRQARAGPLHIRSLSHPVDLAVRLALFPWRLLGQPGTIAADPRCYPFGTRIQVPGYGWGRVEDTGGDVKGPARLDLYFRSHRQALHWGRRTVKARVVKPGESRIDKLPLPGFMRGGLQGLDHLFHSVFTM